MPNIVKDDLRLIPAVEHVQNIRMHRTACKEVLDLLLDNHSQYKSQEEWEKLVTEICESFKLWSELDELERLMQFDIVPGMLDLMRARLVQLGVECQEQILLTHSKITVHSELVPAVISLLDTPDGLDRMECLPPSSLHKAMAFLQRVLDVLSPASSQYLVVHAALMRLQRADSTANLEAPDLTPNISNISDEPFAKGGFSDVYTGEWLRQGKVALKILRILGGAGATRRHRLFRREVKLWHGLRHPHLLQFWGLCDTNQGLAMVSPFLPDGNAAAYLAANPEASTLGLLVGAAYGLEYLHTRRPPITHGDLRGANILVSPAGEACLADFGLSKIMEAASGDSAHGTTTANAGATRWMAPELFNGEPSEYPPSCASIDLGGGRRDSEESRRVSEDRERFDGVTPRSDVWAYGMTIYELMTGKVPFSRIKTSAMVIFAISRGERPSKPVNTRHDWVPELFDLMQACWNTQPSSRPTMSSVSERMRSIREKRQTKSMVPQSLLIAINTPLQPVTPTGYGTFEEQQAEVGDTSFIYESPTTENPPDVHGSDQNVINLVLHSKTSQGKRSIKRKSTAEESSLSRAEADDALPPLPDMSLSRALHARPRASSAPMTVPTEFSLKGISPQTNLPVYQSQNSSAISLVSVSNQSRFSKPSRPATPATPLPDEPPPTPPPLPDSPTVKKRQRISSFWKRSSNERSSAGEGSTTEGFIDPLKTVLPILKRLLAAEEEMLEDNLDASFSSRLRKAGNEVVPIERIDQFLTQLLGGYIRLRRQHRIFMQNLQSAEGMTAEDMVPILCSLLSKTIDSFGAVYPKYAFDIYQVDEVISEEIELNFPFRAWLQESEDVKLRKFLRKPLISIETTFVSLSQWIAFAKLKSSDENLEKLKGLEKQLIALLMRTRLGRWQGAMGRDEVVYNWRQLVARGDTHAFEDEQRQSALFRIIQVHGTSVQTMQSFHKGILRRIVMSPTPHLPNMKRLYTEFSSLLEASTHLLQQLHIHQMEAHPRLTKVTNIVFDSITTWADIYSLYCTALIDALEELELHSAQVFPIVHVIVHPLLKDRDLSSLLWLPLNYLRSLSKSFFNLLDATPDNHEDLKGVVEAISTMNKLVELCDMWTSSAGLGTELRGLLAQLQWRGEEDQGLGLESPERRVIHNGRLLMPQHDSEAFLDLIVVLMDNCLIVAHPRMRWGLSTLQVLHAMLLENMNILDLDAVDDLYLLDASHGETIAAPLPISYETSSSTRSVTLLCFTTLEALEWRRHITVAKVARESAMDAFAKNIFERGELINTVSFIPSCSAEFQFEGTKYFVIGGQNGAGLWIRAENQRGLRQLLAGASIRQCVIVPSLDLMLVLNGKSLIYYTLEDLVSTKITSRQIDTRGSVIFFRTGTHRQSLLLVVAVAPSQGSSSIVRIYETGGSGSVKGKRSSFFSIRETWSTFRQTAEIAVPHRLFDCAILDDALFLMGSDGFLSLNSDSWSSVLMTTYPVFKGLASSQTYHRCKTSKPINVFHHGDTFLLCYSDFGIHVNKQGQIQGQCIDWSSEKVTQALFSPPYALLLSNEMLEARLIQTGRFVDRVDHENIRVTMEGTRQGKKKDSPIIHLAAVDRQSSRGFDLPSIEPCSIHQWKIVT